MSTNPVQDLINRGIISSAFIGQNCQSIQDEKLNRDMMRKYDDPSDLLKLWNDK
jgi:hypothetical protein